MPERWSGRLIALGGADRVCLSPAGFRHRGVMVDWGAGADLVPQGNTKDFAESPLLGVGRFLFSTTCLLSCGPLLLITGGGSPCDRIL